MDSRRVVITGVGVISALGLNTEEFRKNLFAGKSGIDQITSVDVSGMKFQKAGEVRGFDETKHFDSKALIFLDRFTQFLLVAAREAVADARMEWTTETERERTAIITGTGAGGQGNLDKFYIDLFCEKKNRFPPIVVPRAMSNAPASQISMEYGIYGPTYTITTACSSSNHAIGQAFHAVRSGMVDRAITGGSETPIAFGNLKTWESMRVVSPDNCRPFSKNRSGMVLGEGGAVLDFGNSGIGTETRRGNLCRDCRFRNVGGRASYYAAFARWRGAGDARRVKRRGFRAGKDRLHQRARNGDACQRCDGNKRDQKSFR